ncbi:MAG: hypothetical protein GX303_01540 [Clostridiales bacterium]|nr:hypothetical protein [Clostridiales bacterium]
MVGTSIMTKSPKTSAGYSQTALSVKRPTSEILLVYRLLRSLDKAVGEHLFSKDKREYVYSLSIVMISGSDKREEEYIYDIARNQYDARKIFRLLSENTVTPCAVYEVLDDYLASM